MPNPRLSAAVAWLGRVALTADPATTDGQLLTRFVYMRDETAFRELLRRLGPMVLGVCRRVTGDPHLAEDAFQATFLVLSRRAADVRPREAVRGWLYGVAVRTAHKARTMSARRRAREVPLTAAPDGPAPVHEGVGPEALRALDEEVAALPEHLRAAVVLCELGGSSRRDAAARLGIPEGTLSSRLGKARKVLAERLAKRGVALAGIGLCGVLRGLAASAVPPPLVLATSALVDGSAPVPAAVAALVHGVLRTMFLSKLKTVVLGGLLLAAAVWVAGRAGGAATVLGQPPTAIPTSALAAVQPDDTKPQPAQKPAGPGTLLLARQGGLVALTPEGKEGDQLTVPKDTHGNFTGWLSPDGTRAAFVVTENGPPQVTPPEAWPLKVVVRKLGAAEPTAVLDMPAQELTLSWSPDGKRLLLAKEIGSFPDTSFENVLLDPDTGKTEPLHLPAGVRVLDWSRDGKTFLVLQRYGKKYRLGLATKGDQEVRALTELKGWTGRHVGRLSPDGKKVLYTDADPEEKDANKWGRSGKPYLLDVTTKTRAAVADFPLNAQALGVAWSPDGKRIAYTWTQLHPELLKKDQVKADEVGIETEAFLMIADADGKNAQTVASGKGENAINMIFGSVDWR